jgi:hypothetical protein
LSDYGIVKTRNFSIRKNNFFVLELVEENYLNVLLMMILY